MEYLYYGHSLSLIKKRELDNIEDNNKNTNTSTNSNTNNNNHYSSLIIDKVESIKDNTIKNKKNNKQNN